MTTAYTSLLGLALPVTGELSGTWGDVVNNSITSLVDTSVAGTTNISTDANVTLTTTTGASNQARQAILLFSGARTAIRTVTAPAQSKIYTVINATTGGFAVTLVGAGPTTGVTIANGARTVVAWNGSDFVEVSSPSSIILPGGTANGVLYLNGSKVVTSGSALTFDGTDVRMPNGGSILIGASASGASLIAINGTASAQRIVLGTSGTDGVINVTRTSGTTPNLIFQQESAELMRLTSTGLGIGTSSPVEKVQSSKGIAATGANQSVGSLNGFVADYSSGASRIFASRNGVASSTLELWTTDSGGAANKNATLDSSGNLGLGVTPNTSWQSTWTALQVGSGISIATLKTNSGNQALEIGSNYYVNAGYKYQASSTATRYEQDGGAHYWYNAPSGTAGNAITFTQAMTLTAGGNLLVGSTTASTGFARVSLVGGEPSGTGANSGVQFTYNSSTYGGGAITTVNAAGGGMSFYTFTGNVGSESYTERARITSGGQVLIGTPTSPTTTNQIPLLVNTSSSGPAIKFYSNTSASMAATSGITTTTYGDSKYCGYQLTSNGSGMFTNSSGAGTNYISGSSGTYFGYLNQDPFENASVTFTEFAHINSSGLNFPTAASGNGNISYDGSTFTLVSNSSSAPIVFSTNSTERARIDSSGNLLVNVTSASAGKFYIRYDTSGSNTVIQTQNETSGGRHISFRTNGNSEVGSITATAAATSYNTSSDYRLKNSVAPMTGALAKLAQLKPCTYKWNADGSDGEGFIAHELQEVVPQCVTGEKDAVDADGKPVYQGIDTSFLVATLTAAIQEQQAIIESMRTEIDALKAKVGA